VAVVDAQKGILLANIDTGDQPLALALDKSQKRLYVTNAGSDTITVNADVGPVTALLYGGDGNDTLTGGAGDNLLDGGDGNDVLTGSSGRDLLFGGGGADSMNGGSDDDVIVGGTYVDSADLTAARALMATWGSKSTLSYSQRVAAFLGGVDANGIAGAPDSTYRLNTNSVLDDGAADVLTGATGQDWFLAAATDRTDKKGNEVLG
jgi:Ca2+-binding RTX toxin-like protein